ncbi:hypothetical protein B0H13DRAFT_1852439 [Mycena leptocephala]|nr:hypothetical protein B0H13DRAFT_1852439 [Mycena leptocephala]
MFLAPLPPHHQLVTRPSCVSPRLRLKALGRRAAALTVMGYPAALGSAGPAKQGPPSRVATWFLSLMRLWPRGCKCQLLPDGIGTRNWRLQPAGGTRFPMDDYSGVFGSTPPAFLRQLRRRPLAAASHRCVAQGSDAGAILGVRVDEMEGIADPGAYRCLVYVVLLSWAWIHGMFFRENDSDTTTLSMNRD